MFRGHKIFIFLRCGSNIFDHRDVDPTEMIAQNAFQEYILSVAVFYPWEIEFRGSSNSVVKKIFIPFRVFRGQRVSIFHCFGSDLASIGRFYLSVRGYNDSWSPGQMISWLFRIFI